MARYLGLVWEKEPSNSLPKSRPSQVGLGAKGLSHTAVRQPLVSCAPVLRWQVFEISSLACFIAAECVTSAGVSDR